MPESRAEMKRPIHIPVRYWMLIWLVVSAFRVVSDIAFRQHRHEHPLGLVVLFDLLRELAFVLGIALVFGLPLTRHMRPRAMWLLLAGFACAGVFEYLEWRVSDNYVLMSLMDVFVRFFEATILCAAVYWWMTRRDAP